MLTIYPFCEREQGLVGIQVMTVKSKYTVYVRACALRIRPSREASGEYGVIGLLEFR